MDSDRTAAILRSVNSLRERESGEEKRKSQKNGDNGGGRTEGRSAAGPVQGLEQSTEPGRRPVEPLSESVKEQAQPRVHSTNQFGRSPGRQASVPSSSKIPQTSTSSSLASTSTSSIPTTSGSISTPYKPKPVGYNSIIVSSRQNGNPLLSEIRRVPWEYGEIVPDYVTGATSCVLFLSLQYHRLHPEYIYGRFSRLGKDFELRVLLVLVDIENHADPLKELTKACILHDFSMVLSWNFKEAAQYLSFLKSQETAAPTAIQGQFKQDYETRIVDVITTIRGINKNDAVSLIATFGSLKDAILDGGETVETIGGWGETKANRFQKTVSEPFIYNKKYKQRRRAVEERSHDNLQDWVSEAALREAEME